MNFLKVAVVIVGILVFFVAAYHQPAFGREWIEDHAQSEGFFASGEVVDYSYFFQVTFGSVSSASSKAIDMGLGPLCYFYRPSND